MKSHTRDYATAAFRFYALVGGWERYKKKIWDEAVERQHKLEGVKDRISCPTEAAITRAEDAVDAAAAELKDLEAVEKTIIQLERMWNGNDIVKVLKMVYMTEPQRDPERGEISERVHKAELNIPASEKTIYRWLSTARRIFAQERGLRR